MESDGVSVTTERLRCPVAQATGDLLSLVASVSLSATAVYILV